MKAPDIDQALTELQALKPSLEPVATNPKPKRSKLIRIDNERKLIQASQMWVKGMTVRKISNEVGIPKSTLHQYFLSNTGLDTIKKEGLQLIDSELAKSIMKDIKAQHRKRAKASYGELTMGMGVKIDKLRPPNTSVHVGNRTLNITPPKFFRARG